MEKDVFSHKEKYIINSEIKCQRGRVNTKKDLETKRQRVRDQYEKDPLRILSRIFQVFLRKSSRQD